MWKKVAGVVAIAGLIGLCDVRAMRAADGPEATAATHDEAFWNDLTARLRAGAEARRDLGKVGVAEKAKLSELIEKSDDPYLKSMLKDRVLEIDRDLAMNPPPISVDFENASLPDVCDSLAKVMGTPITGWPTRDQGGGRDSGLYTLHQKDPQSFWEIFAALSRQHGLIAEGYDGFRIQQSQPGWRRFVPASNGFVVFPMSLTRSTNVNPQGKAGEEVGKPQMQLDYMVAADPRMRIVRYIQPTLTEVKDDAGNSLLGEVNNNDYLQDNQQGNCLFRTGAGLQIPDNIGKKIVSVKGRAKFLLQVAQETVDVNPKENLGKDVALQGRSMRINNFDVKGNSISFSISSPGNSGGERPMRIAFIDANEKVIWQTMLSGGTGGSTGSNDMKEPVKIRMYVTTQTQMMDVPFELKDLPIP